MKNTIISTLCLVMLLSCQRPFKSVTDHCSTDSRKLKAAHFLIGNMPGHCSYASSRIGDYYSYALDILCDSSLSPEMQHDSLLQACNFTFCHLADSLVPDSRVISDSFLSTSIDRAVTLWDSCSWARQLSFDEFLEWLLPYKVCDLQSLDAWPDSMLSHFGYGLSHQQKNDVEYGTATGIADMLRREQMEKMKRHGIYSAAGLPLLSATLLPRQTFGDIPDYALVQVMLLRSAGVPAVLDMTPVGPRFTAAQVWPVLLDDRGMEQPSEWDMSTQFGFSFFPYERGPKVFRYTYAIDPRRNEYQRKAKHPYPFALCRKDVTDRYFKVSDIEYTVSKKTRRQLSDKYLYIAAAVKDSLRPWQIVDFGIVRKGKTVFENMGREVLYQIFDYDGYNITAIDKPFILHKNGNVEYLDSNSASLPEYDKFKNGRPSVNWPAAML